MDNEITKIKPPLNSKQRKTLRLLMDNSNGITEVLYGGGAGGGKSVLGCIWLIASCLKYPGTRWLMGRSRLSILKTSTLYTFFEVCSRLQLVNGEDYSFNQQSNVIKIFNGDQPTSEILLKDLFTYPSDPEFDSLGSTEFTGAFIDEANQISEKAKNIVMSRLRFQLDNNGLLPKLLMTCNPSKGWVYEYYKHKKNNTLESYKEFVQALLIDNKEFISKHYEGNLLKMDDISIRRLLYGEWEYSESADMFDYDAMVDMFDIIDYNLNANKDHYYLSVDVARLGKDKSCIVVWKGLAIVDIIELSRTTLDVTKAKIEEIKQKYGITNEKIAIDTDGVGGGLGDFIKGSVHIVNGSRPIHKDNYQNLKTQLYFKLSELINTNQIKILVEDVSIKNRLLQELQVMKREKIDQDGKIRMTTKDSVKTKIGRSPDLADALAFKMIWHLKTTGYTVLGPDSYNPIVKKKSKRFDFDFDNHGDNDENSEFIVFK